MISISKKLEVETKESRVIDLIISLIVGSINDTSRINLEANNLLDTIKSKLFYLIRIKQSLSSRVALEKRV